MAEHVPQVAESRRREEHAPAHEDGTVDASAQRLHVVYLAPADIQIARVDRQAIVYFCSALARLGARVELFTLGIRLLASEKHRPDDLLDLYRVRTRFSVRTIPTRLHQESASWITGLTRLCVYAWAAGKRVLQSGEHEVLAFYTKNYGPALALLFMRRLRPSFLILFEAHVPPRNRLQRRILARADGVVANSNALARDLRRAEYLAGDAVFGVHQGIDLEPFSEITDRLATRVELELPLDRRLAVYTGKIYAGYAEVEYILAAAATPAVREVEFVLVGGREDHVDWWREEARRRGLRNVRFTGFVAPGLVHRYQVVADVLLLYYPGSHELNAYRSPGKLFGYMASGVPIVVADLPVLREVLGDPPAATTVSVDSPGDLAVAIKSVFDDPIAASRQAALAKERVFEFTWDRRAAKVLAFVEQIQKSGRMSIPLHNTNTD